MSNSTIAYSQEYLEEYRGHILNDIAITFLVLDITFVGLRVWARQIQGRTYKPDDYLMIPALIACIGIIIVAFIAVDDGGVGRHVQYVSQNYDMFRIWYQTCMIAVPVLYLFAAAFPKLAILSLYQQIFVDKWSVRGTYATAAAIILNVIIMVPILVAKCSPISYGWRVLLDPNTTGGWCANVEPRLQYCSLANIVTDVAMLLLPIPTLYKVKIGKGTKLGLVLTFGMAAIGLVTSCLRFAAFFKTQAYSDGPWASVNLVAWCIVEPGIYMFVASQMAFRPLAMAFVRTPIGAKVAGLVSAPVTKYKVAQRRTGPTRDEEKYFHTDHEEPFWPSTYETTVNFETDPIPYAPPSVFNGNIWVRYDYQVEGGGGGSSNPSQRPSVDQHSSI